MDTNYLAISRVPYSELPDEVGLLQIFGTAGVIAVPPIPLPPLPLPLYLSSVIPYVPVLSPRDCILGSDRRSWSNGPIIHICHS